jgi:hypothetical protein
MSVATILPVSAVDAAAGVSDAEFKRLMGIPRGREMPPEVGERSDLARRWYAGHGRPFIAARRIGLREAGHDSVTLETGDVIAGAALAERLHAGEAHALVALAVSAGREAADEAARLWADERPDESWFLDRFAVAVAEQLVWQASAALCGDATAAGEGLLPHLSPGCGRWDISGQHQLMALLLGVTPQEVRAATSASEGETSPGATLGPLTLLDSGALRPQHSLLAALGVTRRAIVATPESSCRSCDLTHCRYRRARYARGSVAGMNE